jgi:alkylation response protein AidB-like acyl-CoA dehydrogenase
MFFLKTRKDDGSLNSIQVMRLKNKLGTRQLPTGELLLDGTEAELVSDFGRGIPSISPMLTATRIHNSVASVAGMRR